MLFRSLGEADFYYTAFGLRCAALLGIQDGLFWARTANWLKTIEFPANSLIDVFSVLVADRLIGSHSVPPPDDPIRAALRQSATAALDSQDASVRLDGQDAADGFYSAFISLMSRGVLNQTLPRLDEMRRFVLERVRSETKLAKLPGMKHLVRGLAKLPGIKRLRGLAAGVSQVAAAVAVLSASGGVPKDLIHPLSDYIISLQRNDGGVAAHPDAPMSDCLSTFTALVAALDITGSPVAPVGLRPGFRLGDMARFILSLADNNGGFRGVESGAAPDVEYTFYGIGTVSLLAGIRANAS